MTMENARYRILLVEDELFIGLDMAEEMEANGFVVHGPVTDIDSAQKIVGQMQFDAAVLDYRIRNAYSGALSEQLSNKGIPVIFVTGISNLAGKEQLHPTTIVLEKPFVSADLITAVNQVLRLPNAPGFREKSDLNLLRSTLTGVSV